MPEIEERRMRVALAATADIASGIASGESCESMDRRLMAAVRAGLEAEIAVLALFDLGGEKLRVRAESGASGLAGFTFPSRSLPGAIAASNRVEVVPDATRDPRRSDLAERLGLRRLLVAPVRLAKRPCGAIVVGSRTAAGTQPTDVLDAGILTVFAQQASLVRTREDEERQEREFLARLALLSRASIAAAEVSDAFDGHLDELASRCGSSLRKGWRPEPILVELKKALRAQIVFRTESSGDGRQVIAQGVDVPDTLAGGWSEDEAVARARTEDRGAIAGHAAESGLPLAHHLRVRLPGADAWLHVLADPGRGPFDARDAAIGELVAARLAARDGAS